MPYKKTTALMIQRAFMLAAICFAIRMPFASGQESPALPAADAAIPAAPIDANAQGSDPENRLSRMGIPQPLPFLWNLSLQGGVFMIPIALCSIVVVAFAIERRLGLQKSRIIPVGLLLALQRLNEQNNGIDPRLAFDECQKFRSPLGRVIQSAILKVGRPQAELEKTVEDAVSREADEMAQNIRPINVAASIAPLLGLLGTVQGMILAFMVISTTAATGSAKGQELAQGIYTALVTTFAGLLVAIPAIIVANLLEGRIERLLRGMEDVFNEIVPLFERFEGKWRVMLKSDASGVILKGTNSKPDTSASAPGPGDTLVKRRKPTRPVEIAETKEQP
ncbi:MAG: MotA/TolQ/ExbB proton channel family protein [Planctomycetota bacterium]|nr:MotA/TolQ/ExbB proton channel family protein [Planctomycetota bacterium]